MNDQLRLGLDARNPGEYFAGIGLIHVTGTPGRWNRGGVDEFTLLGAAEAPPDRAAEVEPAREFKEAEEELDWRSTESPVRVKWGAADAVLAWWCRISRRGVETSRIKTYSGPRSAEELVRKLAELTAAGPRPRSWAEAIEIDAWTTSSPMRLDARVTAAIGSHLGFGTNSMNKPDTNEGGRKVKVEVAIRPWLELLACIGIEEAGRGGIEVESGEYAKRTRTNRCRYRIPLSWTPPAATAALAGAPDADDSGFAVVQDNKGYYAFAV